MPGCQYQMRFIKIKTDTCFTICFCLLPIHVLLIYMYVSLFTLLFHFFYIEILYPPLFFIVNYYQLTKVDLHIVIEGECFEIDVDYVND